MSGGLVTNIYNFYVGAGGRGALAITAGELHVSRSASAGTTYVGEDGGSGTLTQSGGTFDNGGSSIMVGQTNSTGQISISDGVFANVNGITLGDYGSGSMTISGGVVTNVERVTLSDELTATGVLSIVGSEASIHVAQFRGGANSLGSATLRIAPDSGGLSTINVDTYGSNNNRGKVYITRTTLEVDFSNYDSTNDLTIISYATALTAPFMTTNILTGGWSADVSYDTGNRVVRLTNITAPPKGLVFHVR